MILKCGYQRVLAKELTSEEYNAIKFFLDGKLKLQDHMSGEEETYTTYYYDNGTELRFPVGLYDEVKEIEEVKNANIELHYSRFYGVMQDYSMNETFIDRPYQKKPIKYLSSSEISSKLCELVMGKGKTYCAMKAVSLIEYRLGIIVKNTYVSKWLSDLDKYFTIKESEVLILKSSKMVDNYLNGRLIVGSFKAVIIGFKACYDLICDEDKYPYKLDYVLEKLQLGAFIFDEIHREFKTVARIKLFMDTPYDINLSGTFITDDDSLEVVYQTYFPTKNRYIDKDYDRYITLNAFNYKLQGVKRKDIRWRIPGRDEYNHITFEMWLMSGSYLKAWLQMIEQIVISTYFKDYREGDCCLIYASSLKMIDAIIDHLANRYPKLSVTRFVQGEPEANLYNTDICVSTLTKSGELVDIPNLTSAIMTTSLSKASSNLQALYRPRPIKGRELFFSYLYCLDIAKQVQYHYDKIVLMEERVKRICYYGAPPLKKDKKVK